jgi:hypothetical protein
MRGMGFGFPSRDTKNARRVSPKVLPLVRELIVVHELLQLLHTLRELNAA